MKKLIPVLIILAAVALGCSRFAPGSGQSANNAAPSSTPVPKLVDLPALLGKSVDEVNKILGQNEKLSGGTVSFKAPKGRITMVYSKEGKQGLVSYNQTEAETYGGESFYGYSTAKELAQSAGIDLQGKEPTDGAIPSEKTLYDFVINGQKTELTLKKIGDRFTEVQIMIR